MPKVKILISVFLGLAVVFAQAGVVHAAPQQDGTLITGTVQNVIVETNPETDEQTVIVTLLVNGEPQDVRISLETAVGLGLFIVDEDDIPVLDESGNPVVDESAYGTDVDIDITLIIPDESPAEEKQHPVGAKIADFFSGLFDVDYEVVMNSHSDGFGFGVIAQAMWITDKLGGDVSLFETILEAKKSGDYSLVALPGGTIPQNWGQFKKMVLMGEDDKSLGDIMSGNGDKPGNSGNGGKPENPGNGNGKPENPGNGNGKPENPGKGNKPETPPGQNKDKNKDTNRNGKNK